MKNILKIILFVCFVAITCTMQGQTTFKQRKQPFRNYRLCLGAGASVSPFNLFTLKEIKPKFLQQFNPILSAEIVLSQKRTLAFVFRQNNFSFSHKPTIGFFDPPILEDNFTLANSEVSSQTFRIHLRRYSNFAGYTAPHGRYVSYFISLNLGTLVETSSHSYTLEPEFIGFPTTEVNVPAQSKKMTSAGGLGFCLGKKLFFGENVRQFVEIQMSFEYNFLGVEGQRLMRGANDEFTQPFTKAESLVFRNSLFQLSAKYGLAL